MSISLTPASRRKSPSPDSKITKGEAEEIIQEIKPELTTLEKKVITPDVVAEILEEQQEEELPEEKKVELNESLTQSIIAKVKKIPTMKFKGYTIINYLKIIGNLVSLGYTAYQISYVVKFLMNFSNYNNNLELQNDLNGVVGEFIEKRNKIYQDLNTNINKRFAEPGLLGWFKGFIGIFGAYDDVVSANNALKGEQLIADYNKRNVNVKYGFAGGARRLKHRGGNYTKKERFSSKDLLKILNEDEEEDDELTKEAMRAIEESLKTSEEPKKTTNNFLSMIYNSINFGVSKAGLLAMLAGTVVVGKIVYDNKLHEQVNLELPELPSLPRFNFTPPQYIGGGSSLNKSQMEEDMKDWFKEYKRSLLNLYGISNEEYNASKKETEIDVFSHPDRSVMKVSLSHKRSTLKKSL